MTPADIAALVDAIVAQHDAKRRARDEIDRLYLAAERAGLRRGSIARPVDEARGLLPPRAFPPDPPRQLPRQKDRP